jgi:hypothetical protein
MDRHRRQQDGYPAIEGNDEPSSSRSRPRSSGATSIAVAVAHDDRATADLVERWHGRTEPAALHDLDLVSRHFPQTLLMVRDR